MKATALLVSVGLVLGSMALSDHARAEDSRFYFGGYGGYAHPENLQNILGQGSAAGASFADRNLDDNLLVGLKAGFIPPAEITWFGFELDAYYTGHKVKQGNGPGTADANMEITVVALNWLLRYPGRWIQPYIGAGPAVVFAESFQLGGSARDVGLNLEVGARLLLGNSLMVFGEYKHNRTTLTFKDPSAVETDYRLHALVGGIALVF